MSPESDHAALETLLQVRSEMQADVSEQLLREIYSIEVRLQFDKDRSSALSAIRNAVEAEVERERQEEGGAT